MTIDPNRGEAPGTPPGASPVAPGDRDRIREARRRTDLVYGIGLLVIGIFATIVNMSIFTEQALATQFASLFEQYGAGDYRRPAELGALALAGIIGHPVIYAIALYVALVLWRRKRLAAWVPLVGALVAFLFSAALMAIGIGLHPELVAAASSGAVPTP